MQAPSTRMAAAAAMLLLAGCGLQGPAHQRGPADAAHVVEMTTASMEFQPAAITVRSGDVVEWRNTSLIRHTVTADPRLAGDPANVALPPGVAPFDSGDIPAGQIWRRTFTVPGTYRYVCLPHEAQGMLGTVTVLPAP